MTKSRNTIWGILLCGLFALCLTFCIMGFVTPQTTYATGIEHDHSTWTVWGDEEGEKTSLPASTGDYVLGGDITLSATWSVPEGETNLCLNGYVINANGGSFSVINVDASSTLNLYDCETTSHNGYVDGNGVWHLDATGSHELLTDETAKTITGGIITGSSAFTNGAGVIVKGTFNMYGGNISGNTTTKLGAGIYVNGGAFNLIGGNINYNIATIGGGGGVSMASSTASFIMTGGSISNNIGLLGGGIQASGGTFTMTGGSIDHNSAKNFGGGIYVSNVKAATFGGTAIITNNTSGAADSQVNSNIYIPKGKTITLGTDDNAPTTMSAGVTLFDQANKINIAGAFTTNGTADDVEYFFSDNENFGICFNAGTETVGDEFLEFKKKVVFDEEYEWNDGTAITYGENYSEIAPKVYYDSTEITGLTFIYTYYQTSDGSTWTKSAEKPTNSGNYKVELAVGADDTYTGAKEFAFTIAKAEQEIVISDISKIYDTSPVYFSINDYYHSTCTTLGDGAVTVEYKLASEDDDKYTTTAPTNAGSYVVRVSVAEGTNYLAGSETKEFTIYRQTISQVGFGNIKQPIATNTAPTSSGGMLVNTKYHETLTWSPALVEGKFNYNTVYTATVALEIKDALKENYKFAEEVTLKGAGTGWTKSTDSTDTKLIYTKTFNATEVCTHSLTEVPSQPATCTEDGYKAAYYCSECGKYFSDSLGEDEIGDLTAYNAWKLNEGKLIAKHIVSKIAGVDPTTERSGYKESWKCSECNKYFEDENCAKLIGDETAYNSWKENDGYLPQLQLSNKLFNAGEIFGLVVCSLLLLLIILYLIGYFFLYRKGKLDDKKIRVIYKGLPRGNKNLKEDEKDQTAKNKKSAENGQNTEI